MPQISFDSKTGQIASSAGSVRLGAAGYGSFGVEVGGIFSGTLEFEGRVGSTWVPLAMAAPDSPTTLVTTITTPGTYVGNAAGLQEVRVAPTSFTSGTAKIDLTVAGPSLGGSAGGGGGSGNPGGSNKQVQFNNAGSFGGISNGTTGFVLTSNGAGTTPSFQAIPAPTPTPPGGSNTQIQFNNAGAFDGIGNGTLGQVLTSNGAGVAATFQDATGGVPTTITVANEAADTTSFPAFFTAATGNLGPKTNAGLTFNAATSVLTATGLVGPLTGNVTGNLTGTASIATTATVANEATDTTCFVGFVTAATGNLGLKSNAGLAFNSNTGVLAFSAYSTGNADLAYIARLDGTAGTLTAPATMFVNAHDTAGSSDKPLFEVDMATRVVTHRTSTTAQFPGSEFVRYIEPTGNETTTAGAVAQFRSYVQPTAGTVLYSFCVDALVTIESSATKAVGAIGGVSAWADNTSSVTCTDILALTAVARQTGTNPTSTNLTGINIAPDDATFGSTTLTGTTTNFRGLYIHGYNLAAPVTMVATNRAMIELGTMSGSVTGGYDYALYSLATQASLLTGPLGVNSTTQQNFTFQSTTTTSSAGGVRLSLTAKAANNTVEGFIGEYVSTCTGTLAAGAYLQSGVTGSAFITITDDAVYPALSGLSGVTGVANYSGIASGSIPSVVGVTGVAIRGAVATTGGTVTTLIGVKGSIFQLENSGTVAVTAAFYAAQPLGSATSTITLQAGLYLESQTPASGTTTAAWGIYQAGTEGNFFGGKITTYANIGTAGQGVPAIRQESISTTKTGSHANVGTVTPPAVACRYRITAVITMTSSTNTGSMQVTVDYKDSQGTAHTADILPICDATGVYTTSIAVVAASKEYHTAAYEITVDNSQTNIVVKTVCVGTVSYTDSAVIEQIA